MLFIEVLNQMHRLAGGLKHAGQTLNGSQQDEGLHVCNSILDGLKTERLFWYEMLRTEFDTIINQKDYSVGAAVDNANWVIERPENIIRAGYVISGSAGGSEIQMRVVRAFTEYQTIVNKGIGSSLSWVLYYRASLPTGTAILWPVPTQVFKVAIYTPNYVDEFTDVMATILWPKGYRQFMEYAGAVALHDRNPEWKMNPSVERRAIEYKSRVAASQWKCATMRSDEGALARPDATGRWWGAREFPGGY